MTLKRLQAALNARHMTLAFIRDSGTGKDYVAVELDGQRVSQWYEVPEPEREPIVA